MFVSRAAYFIPGLASGLSLFVEEKRRRAELSMYVLPKALESFWRVATGKVPGGVRPGKTGEALVGRLSSCFRVPVFYLFLVDGDRDGYGYGTCI